LQAVRIVCPHDRLGAADPILAGRSTEGEPDHTYKLKYDDRRTPAQPLTAVALGRFEPDSGQISGWDCHGKSQYAGTPQDLGDELFESLGKGH
jgi:hypothetical protein